MVVYGIYYAIGLTAGGAIVSYFTRWNYSVPFFVLALFCLYFFRDPDRVIPEGPVAVSPADGRVVLVKAESETLNRISIFLNIFDVHVNRSPIGGRIADVNYRPGKFLIASREDASSLNEQNTVKVQGEGTTIVFRQIAGIIARRIIFYKKPGEMVSKGERIGLIKFGSRMDVLFGPEWEITVKPGDRVQAGSSVIARRKGN
jgi:phosphatidylserine decarboxylase